CSGVEPKDKEADIKQHHQRLQHSDLLAAPPHGAPRIQWGETARCPMARRGTSGEKRHAADNPIKRGGRRATPPPTIIRPPGHVRASGQRALDQRRAPTPLAAPWAPRAGSSGGLMGAYYRPLKKVEASPRSQLPKGTRSRWNSTFNGRLGRCGLTQTVYGIWLIAAKH
ncbi:hypothetical protein THAOC_23506, partial [Thalassiosira oceanica]